MLFYYLFYTMFFFTMTLNVKKRQRWQRQQLVNLSQGRKRENETVVVKYYGIQKKVQDQ